MEFGDVSAVDRLELTTDRIVIITDRAQIVSAATFFNRHRDGWVNAWGGGAAPLYIRSYKGREDLGTFGVGERFLSMGTWACYPPEAEIAALVRQLGLPWPPQ